LQAALQYRASALKWASEPGPPSSPRVHRGFRQRRRAPRLVSCSERGPAAEKPAVCLRRCIRRIASARATDSNYWIVAMRSSSSADQQSVSSILFAPNPLEQLRRFWNIYGTKPSVFGAIFSNFQAERQSNHQELWSGRWESNPTPYAAKRLNPLVDNSGLVATSVQLHFRRYFF
jgi:hypothetical protein